jgi:Rrf2 family transcriptional regulator, iron-sulfur cluster assembly transcription factor
MELNTKGRYAVMAMADLAKHAAPAPATSDAIPLSEIAERQQISLAYLEQIFQRLRKSGLVESVRGRSGGYALAVPASAIAISAILQAVEEPVKMTRCQITGDGRTEGGCVGHQRCLTHDLWDALGDHIAGFFHAVTLQDVVDGMPRRSAVLGVRPTGVGPSARSTVAVERT